MHTRALLFISQYTQADTEGGKSSLSRFFFFLGDFVTTGSGSAGNNGVTDMTWFGLGGKYYK